MKLDPKFAALDSRKLPTARSQTASGFACGVGRMNVIKVPVTGVSCEFRSSHFSGQGEFDMPEWPAFSIQMTINRWLAPIEGLPLVQTIEKFPGKLHGLVTPEPLTARTQMR